MRKELIRNYIKETRKIVASKNRKLTPEEKQELWLNYKNFADSRFESEIDVQDKKVIIFGSTKRNFLPPSK